MKYLVLNLCYCLLFMIYIFQGLDGEATEPMIKELEEDREESQDPEVEFAIAGAVRECGGVEILLGMIQVDRIIFIWYLWTFIYWGYIY